MNKAELVTAIAANAELSKKDAEKALVSAISIITDELAGGNKVQLVGFGTFETRQRAARKGKNPQTGAEVMIPAAKVPVFKAGKALKDSVK
ncbi:MAG: HU family DNA-binding protein [Clostridia bacterium]|nr:HU family DNA-binding protein [Clostridia bacterium]